MAAAVERSILITLRARIEPAERDAVIVTLQRHHLAGNPVTSDAEAVRVPDAALALVHDWLHEFEMASWTDDA